MDKLNQTLDKFYTDRCHKYNERGNKPIQNHIDLNTSLDEHFKDLEFKQNKDQSSEYED